MADKIFLALLALGATYYLYRKLFKSNGCSSGCGGSCEKKE
ncbi:MAG: FeoB-associated Cys-rich membrane protein [Sulfurimonas sp.]|jgi:hypothetical protein|nr:FeoB-associated Cys-rich membrane protein [Sulfurimonas sp.]